MAGWSKLADGSVVDCVKRVPEQEILKTNGFGVDPLPKDFEPETEEIQRWFYQFLRVFLKEICGRENFGSLLPPMLGDAQTVDLFKLLLVVRERGGYKAVSKNGLWELVAKESGLESCLSSSVKLVYFKYLDVLERWLERVVDDRANLKSKSSGSSSSLSEYLMELGAEFKGVLSNSKEKVKEYLHLEESNCQLNTEGDLNLSTNDVIMVVDSDEESVKVDSTNNHVDILDVANLYDADVKSYDVEKKRSSSRKRKPDSMWKLLGWVIGIGKNPCDPLVGSLPEKGKWKSYGNDNLWKQVLSYRDAVFSKRHADSNAEQLGWQKMHPSMYDDHIGSSYNLRERGKLVSGDTTTQSRDYPRSLSFGAENDSDKRGIKNHEQKELLQTAYSVFDYEVEKQIPIGPAFQAEIPEWTGLPYECDTKWLGTRVWPLEKAEHRMLIERDRIGKGRQDSCGCQFRDSFECVRFHVAEKRYKLKLELGSAFHYWKIDKMGEEAALSWTEEEQKNFETIVRLNSPSGDKRLWNVIFKCYPTKSREELLSYYFNVYHLRRRAHQNRFTPDDIDSEDDEELESGIATKGFMHETMESTSSIFHSPNKKHKKSR
ncbi:hypothetical protein LWI28_025838 [Acer negundo]|uniref:ARID domain-containing protein n=1 Tax=Acer negundo TaxID=4023 RepID=A0AAD5J338_ACENE|nr:hypothetical protein LWI28_025838 [Acer negundo]